MLMRATTTAIVTTPVELDRHKRRGDETPEINDALGLARRPIYFPE
jgi:hypothetical protein